MELSGKKVLVCNCEGTMALDGKALAKACNAAEVKINNQLCRAEIDVFKQAVTDGQPVVVACTQEAPFFAETLEETNASTPVTFANIRERAGWSEASNAALPKIAALLAEAVLDVPGTASLTLKSEGRVLVYGRDETAIDAAKQLAGRVDPTVLLKNPGEILPPARTDVLIYRGTISAVRGHFGAFEAVVDRYAPARPSSRSAIEFDAPRDGVVIPCDMILDLTGDSALFSAAERQEGYFHPDVGDPALLQKSLFEITDMVGEFEKPIYVAYDGSICAHARSEKVAPTPRRAAESSWARRAPSIISTPSSPRAPVPPASAI